MIKKKHYNNLALLYDNKKKNFSNLFFFSQFERAGIIFCGLFIHFLMLSLVLSYMYAHTYTRLFPKTVGYTFNKGVVLLKTEYKSR